MTYGQNRNESGPIGRDQCWQRVNMACLISKSRPRSSMRNRHSLSSFNAAQQSELSITTQTI